MKSKKPSESFATMTELVFPNDTNILGNLMGGKLLHWMDIVSAISASKHCNRICVTASVDFVDFRSPIRLAEIVLLEAFVTRSFNTSMEVRIDVWAENMQQVDGKRFCNSAYYTFVAVDQTGRPIPVAPVEPETEKELEFYEGAIRRRELRLISAGRMKPDEATHLRKIFIAE
jgi:acyl-CoA hydrolase